MNVFRYAQSTSLALWFFIASTIRLDCESRSHVWESDSEASLTVDTIKNHKVRLVAKIQYLRTPT